MITPLRTQNIAKGHQTYPERYFRQATRASDVKAVDPDANVAHVVHVFLPGVELLSFVNVFSAGVTTARRRKSQELSFTSTLILKSQFSSSGQHVPHVARCHETNAELSVLRLPHARDLRRVEVRWVVFLEWMNVNEMTNKVAQRFRKKYWDHQSQCDVQVLAYTTQVYSRSKLYAPTFWIPVEYFTEWCEWMIPTFEHKVRRHFTILETGENKLGVSQSNNARHLSVKPFIDWTRRVTKQKQLYLFAHPRTCSSRPLALTGIKSLRAWSARTNLDLLTAERKSNTLTPFRIIINAVNCFFFFPLLVPQSNQNG